MTWSETRQRADGMKAKTNGQLWPATSTPIYILTATSFRSRGSFASLVWRWSHVLISDPPYRPIRVLGAALYPAASPLKGLEDAEPGR